MKKNTIVRLVIVGVAALLVLSLGSCAFMGLTMTDVAKNFIDDINGESYNSIKDYLDPDASQYSQVNAAYWQTRFPTSSTYTISSISESGSSVTATVSGGIYGSGTSFRFDFVEGDGGGLFGTEYLISGIVRSGSYIFQ